MQLRYRADIDGLRAVAILPVLFYHAHLPWFSGGFVGVDVFFVISGFLITSIIIKDIQSDTFSIARFYERRIRRIFPALFPVIATTLIAGAFLFDYIAFMELGESVIYTALFTSNILFSNQTGYFDTPSLYKPLLHTWSLAVEEQYYIFFPLLLFAIHRFLKKKYLPWLAGMWTLSLLASIYGVYCHYFSPFFLVHTRAWELLTGSILAFKVIPIIKSHHLRSLVSLAGLGLILYSVRFFSDATPFPGHYAIPPVLGAGMIIYSGMEGSSITSKFLSLKPFVYTGLISYSLYLWHWPLLVFANYLLLRELTSLEISGVLVATFILSALSLKFVEQPFRGTHPIFPERKKLFFLSATVILVFSSLGRFITIEKGMPYRNPKVNAPLMRALDEPFWDAVRANEAMTEKKIERQILPRTGSNTTTPEFILWGDSHASSLIPVIDEKAKHFGVSGFIATHGGYIPLLGVERPGFSIHEFNDGVIRFIKNHSELKTVILAAYWSSYNDGLKDVSNSENSYRSGKTVLREGFNRTLHTLLDLGCYVVIVRDVPTIGFDVFKDYYMTNAFGTFYHPHTPPTLTEHLEKNKEINAILSEYATLPNVTIISPDSLFFDKKGRAIVISGNEILYRDNDHLSKYGAFLIGPLFDDVFKSIK